MVRFEFRQGQHFLENISNDEILTVKDIQGYMFLVETLDYHWQDRR